MLKPAGASVEGQIEEHSAKPDAHTKDIFEVVRTGTYIPSPLASVYRLASSRALSANRFYAYAYPITRKRTIDQIFVHVASAAAGKNLRVCIYADDGNCYPGELISSGGVVNLDTSGLKTVSLNLTLEKGLYWITVISDGAPSLYSTTTHMGIIGSTANGYDTYAGWNVSNAYGEAPSSFPSGGAAETALCAVGFHFTSND